MLIYWFKIRDLWAMAHVVDGIVNAVEATGADVAGGEIDEAILASRTVRADHDIALWLGIAEYAVFVWHYFINSKS